MNASHPTWYLLYDGASEDGRGHPQYVGRTTSREEAERHYRLCHANPYSTGSVLMVTDKKAEWMWIDVMADLRRDGA